MCFFWLLQLTQHRAPHPLAISWQALFFIVEDSYHRVMDAHSLSFTSSSRRATSRIWKDLTTCRLQSSLARSYEEEMGEQPATLVERIGKVSCILEQRRASWKGNCWRLWERYLASFYGTTISGSDMVTNHTQALLTPHSAGQRP